jgi:murein DD-endopeptidase MepM/ murein hydrolase activator NlpD
MRPLVRIALSAAATLVVARGAERYLPAEVAFAASAPGAATPSRAEAACPAGTLPDHGACIPVPLQPFEDGPSPEVEENAHRDRAGRLVRYEHIPRRPERPPDYRRYLLPIPVANEQSFATSGYDLDLPDAEQRRGSHLKAVGHGGVDLAAPRGTPVRIVRLERQVGPAEVLFVGELFGTSVVTRHAVTEAGVPHDYLIIHGHLERAATGLRAGDAAPDGATLGFVGDTGSPGAVHLHFETRRARDDVNLRELGPRELVHNAKTIACDPRNVLEFASGESPAAR